LNDSPAHGGAAYAYVTHRFFDVFHVPIVRGRAFTERDDAAGPRTVIINEAFAKQYWPQQNPLGQRLTIGRGAGPAFADSPREIIGVVADARDSGLNSVPEPEMFLPLAQVPDGIMALNNRFLPLSWVVRTTVNPVSAAPSIQRVFETAAALPAARVRTMEQVVIESTAREKFNTTVLGLFAFVALILASIGLYGLMAYAVEQRTLEFGIRLALGAESGNLWKMVVGQALVFAAAGIAIGLAAAFGLTRLMSSMLFEVKPTDAFVFGSVSLILGSIALLASYIPARRATKIDPIVALRYE
jgi:predicted permease